MTAGTAKPMLLLDPELHATGDPHEVWAWMRAHAPVYRHPPTELPGFWSVTRYRDVRDVYRDPGTFSSTHGVLLRPQDLGEDPGGGMTLALTDPPRHKALRSLVAARFSERAARALGGFMERVFRRVIARAVEQGECDFAHDVAARSASYLISRLMGVDEDDYDDVFAWTGESFHAGRPLTAHQDFMRYYIDLMYRRMEEPAADVMSMFVDGSLDGELLSEKEILLNVEHLVGATENAGLSMATGMLAFLEHPEQWDRLRRDPSLMASALEEVLRWASSATHSMRTATRDAEICGQRIEPGDRVVVWIPSANRDDRVFADPFRFDIGRKPNRHLALGVGEHVCIGGSMARTQMRVLLTVLLDMGAHLELRGPVVPLRSLAVNGPEQMPVTITVA